MVFCAAFVSVVLLGAVLPAQVVREEPGDDGGFGGFKPYDPVEGRKRKLELAGLSREFQKLLEERPEVRERHPDDFARVQLKLEKCALLVGRYMPSAARDESFRKELEEARAIVRAFAAGREAPPARTGLVERAYLSDIDRSAQPYYLYVPETLDLEKPVPLVLFLHGYIGNLDKVNWYDQTCPDSMKRLAEQVGGIMLAPFARSNTDFLGIGERDVLHTIELTMRDYPVDPDRVYLCGASMGGSGVWAIAAHYPHLFAVAVPASGRTDYNLWQNVERGVLTEFKQLIVDRDFAVTLQPNFRSLPVYAFHGEDDWLVNPDQSKVMVNALKATGFEALYHEFPRGDHWSCFDAFDSDQLVTWLRTKVRERAPKRVTYRTFHPRFNRAYWVTIDDFAEFGKPAEVDATVESPTVVRLEATNVARLTLHGGEGAPLRAETVKVRLADGRMLDASSRKEAHATFTLSPLGEGKLRKRGDLCGPVQEAYQRPFLMVFGTTGEEEAQLRVRRNAGTAALEWFDFAAGIPRFKKDTAVTGEDIKRFNLICFGTPATNRLLARIAGRLPVKVEEGRFTIGGKVYAGENLGLAMIYPNPLNPERYVVLHSGTHWGKGLPRNHKLDFLPDYIVFDDTVGPVSGTNNFKVAGFFDIHWKFDERLCWSGPEKAPPEPKDRFPGWDEPWPEEPPGEP